MCWTMCFTFLCCFCERFFDFVFSVGFFFGCFFLRQLKDPSDAVSQPIFSFIRDVISFLLFFFGKTHCFYH